MDLFYGFKVSYILVETIENESLGKSYILE